MFFTNSRYEKTNDYSPVDSRGNKNRVKRIRKITQEEPVKFYIVKELDRLDHLADSFYANSSKFWRLCDVNGIMFPNELLKVGKKIAIPKEQY